MAKRTRRRRNKKWLKIGLFLILVIIAGVVCYLVWDAYFKEDLKAEVEEPGTAEVVEPNEEVKEEAGTDDETEPVVEEKEEIKQYEGENPNEKTDLTGSVTYAEVHDGVLRVRVNIDQFVAEGSCELSLVKEGRLIYTEIVGVESVAATATCRGFDVAATDLGMGAIQVIVKVSAGGKIGIIYGEATL